MPALGGAERSRPALHALPADEGRLSDCLEGMDEKADAPGRQVGEGGLVGQPAREEVDVGRAHGLGKGGDHIAQRAVAFSQQRNHDLSAEALAAPACGRQNDTRQIAARTRLEIEDRRLDLARDLAGCPRVNRSIRDGSLRPRRQDRSSPNKVLVHAPMLAWTSATCVAHAHATVFERGCLAQRS